MGRYVSSDAVLIRLQGKVKVTDDPESNPDRLPLLLLNRLISEAEAQVEYDLSTRYFSPFQTVDCGPFSQVPERPTKEIIRTLCELVSVIRVLETDFGRGSSVDASAYALKTQERYDKMIAKLVELRPNTFNVFKYPPLPGLLLNYQVSKVDYGFAGYVSRTDDTGHGGFPALQINDPSQNFWNGFIDANEEHFNEEIVPGEFIG